MKRARKWQYKVSAPMLSVGAMNPVMDCEQMTAWLNNMDERGWEFVSHAHKYWVGGLHQDWWVFRRVLVTELPRKKGPRR